MCTSLVLFVCTTLVLFMCTTLVLFTTRKWSHLGVARHLGVTEKGRVAERGRIQIFLLSLLLPTTRIK